MSDKITKEKFNKYVEIQNSGKTNMFLVNDVVALSDGILCKDDCLEIMKNYEEYFTPQIVCPKCNKTIKKNGEIK